jgi:hypothetical protein
MKVPDWQAMIDRAAEQQCVFVSDFDAGDVIIVDTLHHRYLFKVLEPERRRVEMTSNHPDWPGPIVGCLQGSLISPIGMSLMGNRIAVGLCACFTCMSPDGIRPMEIRTTAVRAVFYKGARLLPSDPKSPVH